MKTIAINGQDIIIRAFGREDALATATFAQNLPEHDLLFLSRDLKHARVIEAWWQAVDAGDIDSLVAVADGQVLATTAVVRDPLSWSPHVAEIRLLVAANWRGHGLGRVLLEESIRLAAERGATKLVARMTPDQRGAIALFEETGFRGEAMLRDQVRSRDGALHDLAILSLHLERDAQRKAAWGLDAPQ
ncbi:MAG: N-acetyltransferase family protein [Sphingomonadaceae bacterium]